MSSIRSHPPAAYIEDYNEDAHTTLPETRQTANIAAKRSKPDFAKLKTAHTTPDENNDPDSASLPVATVDAGDSSLPVKQANPPLRVNTAVATAFKKIKSKTERKSASTPKSAQKSSLRPTDPNEKKKGRSHEVTQQEDCVCSRCLPKAQSSTTPLDKPRGGNLSSKGQPARPQTEAPIPPQPSKLPATRPDINVPILQPAQARPRAASIQSYRAVRPMSFHGGVTPDYIYPQPIYIEQRPVSAFPHGLSFPPPSYPPPKPNGYFPPPIHAVPLRQEAPPAMSYNYDPRPLPPVRPQPRQWTSEQLPPPRPPTVYSSSPIAEHPGQPMYPVINSASQPTLRHSFNQQERTNPMSKEFFFREEDYYLTRQPRRVGEISQQHRPTIRHSATSLTANPTLHHSRSKRGEENLGDFAGGRSPRKASPEKRQPPSRPSLAGRPFVTSSYDRPMHNYAIDRNTGQVYVESSVAAKQGRRASVYGGELPHDLVRDVEAYQSWKNAAAGLPISDLTADSLKMVRKKTQSSDSGSRRSGEGKRSREGSEIKRRGSTDRRGGSDVKARPENDRFTIRVPKGANVDLKGGGVEGKTINLRQLGQGDGGMELSIGSREMLEGRRNDVKDKSQKRSSYIDSSGLRELEYARSASRVSREDKERESREKERRALELRTRRSSQSGRRDRMF